MKTCYLVQSSTIITTEENPMSINSPLLQQKLESNKNIIKITEYQAKDFSKIQEYFGVDHQMILNSVDLELNKSNIFNISEGEGKSGSFFFFTFDKKYLIKTITTEELRTCLKFLKAYRRHLTDNLGSIMTIILGIYTIKIEGIVPVHIILMINSLPKLPSFVFINI